jgi:hypothetical protein
MFRYIPYSLVSLGAHDLLRFIPSLVSPMDRNPQYVSLYTIQSCIAWGLQFAIRFSLYIIQSDIICTVCFACGSQVAIRSVYTIQSGIAGGPQCVMCYTIRSGSALWVAIRNVFH